MLLKEFDPSKEALVNAHQTVEPIPNFPKVGISCFSSTLFNALVEAFHGEEIASLGGSNGKKIFYKIQYKGIDVVLYMSSVGAPACVGLYEEACQLGMEKLVLFGTCGVLSKEIKDCSIIIPTHALRDEGTSFHYVEASDEIDVNQKYIPLFQSILDNLQVHYTIGKTWTTDAIYRETKEKMLKRKEAGCVCVEMECSAMAACSSFKEKEFFTFFYAADNLDAEKWDRRSLSCEVNLDSKMSVALLALEMAIQMN